MEKRRKGKKEKRKEKKEEVKKEYAEKPKEERKKGDERYLGDMALTELGVLRFHIKARS